MNYNAPFPKETWPEGSSYTNKRLREEQNYSIHDFHDHWWTGEPAEGETIETDDSWLKEAALNNLF